MFSRPQPRQEYEKIMVDEFHDVVSHNILGLGSSEKAFGDASSAAAAAAAMRQNHSAGTASTTTTSNHLHTAATAY